MKDKYPLDIQQKVITPVSTALRAATGIVTTYMVDVVVVWVWLTILLHILKFTQSPHIFTTVRVTSNHRQFCMVTDHEPGLSSKYGNVPLILQVFSQSCEKYVIKHSELPIRHFKWHGIITQLCSIVHMHSCTLHTHITHLL